MFSTKFHPNPLQFVRVTSDFQLKERKSTFEIPADSKSIYIPLSCHQNAIPLRLSSFSQDSITTHSPYPHPNLIKIHQHPLKLLTDSNSKSTYIPLSCRQNAIPLRLSSFSQGSITTHSPCSPQNFIQIHCNSSELQAISNSKSDNPHLKFRPTQRALIYLWVATKTQYVSDWAHFHRAAPGCIHHVPYQISFKSNDTRPSYKRFPTQRAIIYLWVATKTRSPLIEFIFTGINLHTLAMLSTKFDPNPMTLVRVTSDFQLKEQLYTFELPPKRDPLWLSSYSQG